MTTTNGVCKFCGQTRIIQVSDDKAYSQDELDKIAESECDCDVAKLLRARNEAYGSLQGMLDEMYPDDAIDDKERHIKKLLQQAGKLMSETYIDSIRFRSGKENYSLTLTQQLVFKLKINRTETEVRET